jgi:hypothetical protein
MPAPLWSVGVRAFLIFLAVAAPVVLFDPFFWSLWRMETSRERVVYVRTDGVSQAAWIGPKAPWPGWATVPTGTKLRVNAHFEPVPGESATGFADVNTTGPAMDVVAGYERLLTEQGWSVSTYRQDLISADLPPRPLRYCILRATRDTRGLMLQIERQGSDRSGRLFWSEPPHPVPIGAAGSC